MTNDLGHFLFSQHFNVSYYYIDKRLQLSEKMGRFGIFFEALDEFDIIR